MNEHRLHIFFAVVCLALVSGCGNNDATTDGAATGLESRQDSTSAIETTAPDEGGLPSYIRTFPNPCTILTELGARDVLNVESVVANPANSGPESNTPRCGYRDNEQLGRNVSIVAFRTPSEVINSTLPAEDLSTLLTQSYGEAGSPFQVEETGPGAQRFSATAGGRITLFVMSGVAVPGGAYDPNKINAEAAFAVSLTDPSRSAEERLTEARNIAARFQSEVTGQAQPR